MPDWLTQAFHVDKELALEVLFWRQAVAFLAGCVVAYIYWLTQRGQAAKAGTGGRYKPREGSSQTLMMMATLVLLTVLIGMIGSVIQDNIARAFSLVGALSIVRFRTVVEDTRDTAFVIFAVAVGMAIGAGYLMVPLVGIPFVAAAAWLFRPRGESALAVAGGETEAWLATVRLGAGFAGEPDLKAVLNLHAAQASLTEIVTSRQGAAVDRTYRLLLRGPDGVPSMVNALNALQGVQQVEVRREG